MNGPTVYGGYGCPGSPPVPQRSAYNFVLDAGEEAILVLQRGPTDDTNNPEAACFPGQKAERAWDAGWRNVLFVNRHLGSAGADTPFCGSGGYVAGKVPVSVCTTHTAAHDIFDDAPPEYTTPYDDEAEMAAIGTVGDRVRATSQFDGWGYAHLYRHETGKVTRVDSWAVRGVARRAVLDRLRRSLDSRACGGPDRERLLRRVLQRRREGDHVRRSRHRRDRSLHRRQRQQLLGRGALQRPGRP